MTLGLGDCFFRPLDKNIVSVSGFDFQIIDTEQLAVTEQYDFREADPMGIGTYRSIYSPMLQGDYFTFWGLKRRTLDTFVGLVFSIIKPANLFGNTKSSAKRNSMKRETN